MSRVQVKSTPLYEAACSGRKNVVELLLAKGADVTAKNEQGRTPNQCAEELGHAVIVELRRQFFK